PPDAPHRRRPFVVRLYPDAHRCFVHRGFSGIVRATSEIRTAIPEISKTVSESRQMDEPGAYRKETNVTSFAVKAIGRVESPLTDLESAPRQADEGAPEAWLVFEPEMLEGLASLRPGDEVIVISWLDRARRDVLSVHPRG